MNNQDDWFKEFEKTSEYSFLRKRPIAYFCTEYGLSSQLPAYAGGLGVLSGDFIKEAGCRNFPLVGVGLYYHEGYARRPLSQEEKEKATPAKLGLTLVINQKKEPILVSLPIYDRTVYAQVWQWREDSVSVYFLDPNVSQNSPADRQITDQLYTTNKETRLEQEMILGIGGLRLLNILGVKPSVFHINEGHSAFLVLELIKQLMECSKIDFVQACRLARQQVVFTNHTLLPAGREVFSNDLVATMLNAYAESLKVPVSEIISLGLIKDSSLFSMTLFSLQLSTKMNAVSALHAKEAAKIWTNHPIEWVTNGVFIPRWDRIQTENKNLFWSKHQENKRELLKVIKEKTGENWNENHLLVGWAKRIVPYKRPLAILENIEGLKKIAQNSERPLKLVFAGLCHAEDPESDSLFEKMQGIIRDLKGLAVYLPGYNIELAQLLTAGCDIWLNTPVVKSEACGTSGMKAALNGVLPVSTKDGWIDEVELFGVGWIADDANINQSLLTILGEQVTPMYYEHLKNPLDSDWLKHMQNSREMILNQFGMARVLREYIEKMYQPIFEALKN